MRNAPSNTDDVIDSRDVIERIEELEAEREQLAESVYDANSALRESVDDDEREVLDDALEKAKDRLDDWYNDNGDELKALKSLADEAEGYAPDWHHGATLIRGTYFGEYAEEMLKDIGDLPKDIPHYIVIDWEATADNIREDYTAVDFDGIEYWVR